MLSCFDFIRQMNWLGVAMRLITAVVCGGCIGIEREFKRRPAGFRTHILICLGAAMTTLTSQYLLLVMNLYTDVARLGAQVIAGIGFIGAGTIIVTNRKRVKGLTTAAGLWTAAIIGLVCGAGFVECGVFATGMVLLAELVLIKIEYRFAHKQDEVNLYIEYGNAETIQDIIRTVKDARIAMTGLEITRVTDKGEKNHCCAVVSVQADKNQLENGLVKSINAIRDVLSVEEL